MLDWSEVNEFRGRKYSIGKMCSVVMPLFPVGPPPTPIEKAYQAELEKRQALVTAENKLVLQSILDSGLLKADTDLPLAGKTLRERISEYLVSGTNVLPGGISIPGGRGLMGGVAGYIEKNKTQYGIDADKIQSLADNLDWLDKASPKSAGFSYFGVPYSPYVPSPPIGDDQIGQWYDEDLKDVANGSYANFKKYNISRIDKNFDNWKRSAEYNRFAPVDLVKTTMERSPVLQKDVLRKIMDSGLITDTTLQGKLNSALTGTSKEYKPVFDDVKQYLINNKDKFGVAGTKLVQLANSMDYVGSGLSLYYDEKGVGVPYTEVIKNYEKYAKDFNIPKLEDVKRIGTTSFEAQKKALEGISRGGLILDNTLKADIANAKSANDMEPLYERIKAHLLANKSKYGVDATKIESLANALIYVGSGMGILLSGDDSRTLREQIDDFGEYTENTAEAYNRMKVPDTSNISAPKMSADIEEARATQAGETYSRSRKQGIPFVGTSQRKRESSPYYEKPKITKQPPRPASSLYTRVKTGK